VFPQSVHHDKSSKTLFALVAIVLCFLGVAQAGTVDIRPGADIPSVVNASPAGTTFIVYPGLYRLTEPIAPKDGDSFLGQTACAPPTTSCPAIISGSRVIGSLATFDGTHYKVTGQTQQGAISISTAQCEPGWDGCIYPEDLFFDGVPYTHLYSGFLPNILSQQWWFDYSSQTIYFHDNPVGHVVETSVVPAAFSSWANNVTISDLTIKGFAAPANGGAAIGPPGNPSQTLAVNWKIQNCEISLNHSGGVMINFGMQILNNYIRNNGEIGIYGGMGNHIVTDGLVIAQNLVTYNNYAHFLPGYGSGGMKISSTLGAVIRGNTVTNNDGAGIHFDMNAASPLVDGNIVMNNASGGGLQYEISLVSATFRNNVVVKNGVNLPNETTANPAVGSFDSVGVNSYCNVLEIPNAAGAYGWAVVASKHGTDKYLPSAGNTFHHNTVIFDGSHGWVGFSQHDPFDQPNFFANNPAPDFNAYHMPNASATTFKYDNNESGQNTNLTFAEYQARGADVHGTMDTKYNEGYPTVKITSPADETNVNGPVTVTATASDSHGINKVEFFVDWKLASTVISPPYNYDWSTATTGTHTVAAMAYSDAGISACYAVTLHKN